MSHGWTQYGARPKWYVRRARVNDEPGLLYTEGQTPLFARIPEGYYTVQTTTEYLALIQEGTGNTLDLVWEPVPPNATISDERR